MLLSKSLLAFFDLVGNEFGRTRFLVDNMLFLLDGLRSDLGDYRFLVHLLKSFTRGYCLGFRLDQSFLNQLGRLYYFDLRLGINFLLSAINHRFIFHLDVRNHLLLHVDLTFSLIFLSGVSLTLLSAHEFDFDLGQIRL